MLTFLAAAAAFALVWLAITIIPFPAKPPFKLILLLLWIAVALWWLWTHYLAK